MQPPPQNAPSPSEHGTPAPAQPGGEGSGSIIRFLSGVFLAPASVFWTLMRENLGGMPTTPAGRSQTEGQNLPPPQPAPGAPPPPAPTPLPEDLRRTHPEGVQAPTPRKLDLGTPPPGRNPLADFQYEHVDRSALARAMPEGVGRDVSGIRSLLADIRHSPGPGLLRSIPRGLKMAADTAGVVAEVGAQKFSSFVSEAAPLARKAAFGDNQSAVFAGLSKAAGMASSALSMLGPIGKGAGMALEAVVGSVGAFKSVVDAFVERGKQLQSFSGELVGANVRSEIANLQADIKEAQELGPALAELTDANTEFQSELREILLPIKKWLIETLASWLKGIIDLFHKSVATWEAIKAGFTAISGAVQAFFEKDLDTAKQWLKELPEHMKRAFKFAMFEFERERQDPKGIIDQQLAAFENQILPNGAPLNFPGVNPRPAAPGLPPVFNF